MKASKEQKMSIRKNCGYDINIKEELVQWATNDNNKTSLNDLSFEQANKILIAQGDKPIYTSQVKESWGLFNKANSKHLYILSLLRQMGMIKEVKGRDVADIDQLSNWLKSSRSPVQKPLKNMSNPELSRIIHALELMVTKKWK